MAKGELTQKQEAFVLAFIETGNAAEAYRRAYDVRSQTLHSTIYSSASRLLADPNISARVNELRSMVQQTSIYSALQALEEYELARKMATEERNASAAVSAINGKVKLYGLDQPQKIDHQSSDGSLAALLGLAANSKKIGE